MFLDRVRLDPDTLRMVDSPSDLLVLEYAVVFTHQALPGRRAVFRGRTALEHWWPGATETLDEAAHDGLNRVLVEADEEGNDRVFAVLDEPSRELRADSASLRRASGPTRRP